MIQNEFSADGGGTAFVHTLCLRVWVDVSRALMSPDGSQ